MVAQLQEVQMTMQQTTHKADMALDFAEKLCEENGTLKQEIKDLKDKTVLLDRTLRRKHVKYCGLPEEIESSQDLLSKINLWLTKVLEIGESTTLLAQCAYRVRAILNQRRSTPRDVVTELTEDNIKWRITDIARKQGHLQYQETKILIFQDLPTEAIQIRKALKSVIQLLRDAKIKYRWLPMGKIRVYHKGEQLIAHNETTGKDLLYVLNLDLDSTTHGEKEKTRHSAYTSQRQ